MKINFHFSQKEIKKFKNNIKKLKKGQLKIRPFFQKIIDKNKNIFGYESLFRLENKKNKKRIENSALILTYLSYSKQSHKTYTMVAIKNFKTIFNYFEKKLLSKNIKTKIFVNISLSYDLLNDQIYELLKYFLKKKKLNKYIVIEIIENDSFFINQNTQRKAIQRLLDLECEIALDDFGCGNSNFDKVIMIQPDYIKIDGIFMKNLDNPQATFFVKKITDFAKKNNIITIAEFIENKKIFEKAKKMNIDFFQGFYFI